MYTCTFDITLQWPQHWWNASERLSVCGVDVSSSVTVHLVGHVYLLGCICFLWLLGFSFHLHACYRFYLAKATQCDELLFGKRTDASSSSFLPSHPAPFFFLIFLFVTVSWLNSFACWQWLWVFKKSHQSTEDEWQDCTYKTDKEKEEEL